MKIETVEVIAYAVVETDHGAFRVWRNGAIDFWNIEIMEFGYFDEYKYSEQDVKSITTAGIEAIAKMVMK